MAHKITWTEQQWGDVSITEAQLDRLNRYAAEYLDTHYPEAETESLTVEEREEAQAATLAEVSIEE